MRQSSEQRGTSQSLPVTQQTLLLASQLWRQAGLLDSEGVKRMDLQ